MGNIIKLYMVYKCLLNPPRVIVFKKCNEIQSHSLPFVMWLWWKLIVYPGDFLLVRIFGICCCLVTAHFTHTLQCCLTHLSLDKMTANLADNRLKWIFFNENDRIPIRISLKFIPSSIIDNKPALVQVMAWHRTGDMPLPEPMKTQFTGAYMRH